MLTIWKWEIECNSCKGAFYTIDVKKVPLGAKPVSVGLQNDICCVWMEVDTIAPLCTKHLFCVGTGFGSVPSTRFIGTIIEDPYVWHIYDGD